MSLDIRRHSSHFPHSDYEKVKVKLADTLPDEIYIESVKAPTVKLLLKTNILHMHLSYQKPGINSTNSSMLE